MSFHKRWLSEAKLRTIFENTGIPGLQMAMRADAFICEDKFSSEFVDLYNELSDDELKTNLTDFFNVSRITS